MTHLIAVLAADRTEFRRWVFHEHPDYVVPRDGTGKLLIARPPKTKATSPHFVHVTLSSYDRGDSVPWRGVLIVGSWWAKASLRERNLLDWCCAGLTRGD